MELKGERQLPADRATAWALLNDSEVLKLCVPGCESMTANGTSSYDILMTTAIGPVRARFKGKLSLTDIEAPRRYRLLFEGQSGQDQRVLAVNGELLIFRLHQSASYAKIVRAERIRQEPRQQGGLGVREQNFQRLGGNQLE